MARRILPYEARFLGWCAIQWTHFGNRFKEYAGWLKRIDPTIRYKNTSAASRPFLFAKQASMKRKTAPNPEERKLKEIVEESKNILISAQAVFPFQLFPTRITLDRHKLTIVHRSFFWAEQTVSVPIEDIKNIQADIGPIFGSVTITSPLFINNEQKVDCLHREDARCIQKLVQGATVALKEKIDLSKVETSELNKLLMDLGEGHTV